MALKYKGGTDVFSHAMEGDIRNTEVPLCANVWVLLISATLAHGYLVGHLLALFPLVTVMLVGSNLM